MGDTSTADTPQSGAATASPQSATNTSQPTGNGTQDGAKKESDGAAEEKKKEGKKFENLKEIVSLAWKGLLFLGGIFLLIFFLNVGFFPNIKLADLTATLAAVSMTGLLMLVIFAAAFVFPALMAHGSLARLNGAEEVVRKSAFLGAVPAWAFCLWLLKIDIWWKFGGTVGLLILLALGLTYRKPQDAKDKPPSINRAAMDGEDRCSLSELWNGEKRNRSEVVGVIVAFFFGQIIAAFYFALTSSQTGSNDQLPMFFAWPVICFGANIIVLTHDRADDKRRWKYLGSAAGLLLLIFLMMTSASSLMSASIASRLALGGIPDAAVMLSKQGCEIAKASSCNAMECQAVNADGTGVVGPVTIVSRIGSEVVLQPKNPNFQVVMKSEDVLGWSRKTPRAFLHAASSVTGDSPNQGGNETQLDLPCRAASAPVAASPPAIASSPPPAPVPQASTSSATALSAVALAEIRTTVQSTLAQTMATHRHSVAIRAPAPVVPSATNVFYDNHGDVTVNNLGNASDAGNGLRVNTPEEKDCAAGSACLARRAATIDALATHSSATASTIISASASATLKAAAEVSR
ncbi:hypothetical protein LMG28614_05987 [Paraburkholderia ultramafica]|uniref:Uncharacterized protein n=2 Tax=Paraburkholderia ultramafica TaxID=1544867 RepID=A0A6S7BL53_9BURK|nr:hypothetical protein LMG28614_05987 [Paraburkholderia ultramafica]